MSLSAGQFDAGHQFGPLLCRTMNDLNAAMRELVPDWPSMSCESIVVDISAQPPNFYVAARSTSIGGHQFSFVGTATVDDCERVRTQLLDSKRLTGGWRDGRCQPAVLTVR